MSIPKLKRIRVSSEQDLRNWLVRNSDQSQEVMIVTCNKGSRDKHVSREIVLDQASQNGWEAARSYTLDGGLVGHVVSPRRLA